MRHVFLLWLCLQISTYSFGQKNESSLINAYILKGTYLVGGNISTSYKNYTLEQPNIKTVEQGRALLANLETKGGYFLFKDVALGFKANLRHLNEKAASVETSRKETDLLLGPFIRGYLHNGIFGEAGAGFGKNNVQGIRSSLFEGSLGVGYAYFLNQKIALEPMLVFNYFEQKYGGELSSNRNKQYGPEFKIGIQAYLFKHKLVILKK